jgi:hypothetical protein
MARHCNYNTSQYLERAGVPVAGPPLTLSLWVKMDTAAQFAGCLCNGSSNAWFNVGSVIADLGKATAYEYDGATIAVAKTSAIPAATWVHLCAVFPSHVYRVVYLNGAAKVIESATGCVAIAVNKTLVATAYVAGAIYATNFGGDFAEFAIYNTALADADVALLAAGKSAALVQAGSLAAYYKLLGTTSPEPDEKGGRGRLWSAPRPRIR